MDNTGSINADLDQDVDEMLSLFLQQVCEMLETETRQEVPAIHRIRALRELQVHYAEALQDEDCSA